MTFLSSSGRRAGILLVALALVGGTGCVTTLVTSMVVSDMHDRREVREKERKRLERIAELTPRAEAGDAHAMTSLAQALMSAQERSQNDMRHALGWLSRAAVQEDALAQAMLGDLLSLGTVQSSGARLKTSQLDHARGIALLQKAAVQACTFFPPREGEESSPLIQPADRLGGLFEFDHYDAAARLWHARSILHCGVPSAYALSSKVKLATTAEQKQARFAMLLLTGSGSDIERARPMLAQEDVEAAERQAAELRRLVAQSEQEYPVPRQKEIR